jgi:hypothetical protein
MNGDSSPLDAVRSFSSGSKSRCCVFDATSGGRKMTDRTDKKIYGEKIIVGKW